MASRDGAALKAVKSKLTIISSGVGWIFLELLHLMPG
jgi:hypothetical protein